MATKNTPSTKADVKKIHFCKIHPGIGIARVGNSPDQYFIGPELPGAVPDPRDGFKDKQGRLKRQAARFRIYGYDKNEQIIGELTAHDAKISWTVHLANKKGAWYEFQSRSSTGPKPLRNRCVQRDDDPDDRDELIIDPGARTICGVRKSGGAYKFDGGQFLSTEVPLGELRTDACGRLLVLGGHGTSASVRENKPITHYANNDYWYDDVSDGPVTAKVECDGRQVDAEAAWVVVAPPNFAPGVQSVVTLYEVIRDVAVGQKRIKESSGKVKYYRDIHPILSRLNDLAWVSNDARRGHGFHKPGDFKLISDRLQTPDHKAKTPKEREQNRQARKKIFERIRVPLKLADGETEKEQATSFYMPPLSGDEGDATDGEPGTWMSLLPSQYKRLEKWAEGNFETGTEPTTRQYSAGEQERALAAMDAKEQVEALQRAALEPCVGGAFYPGIEMTYIAADASSYSSPFRISEKFKAGDITKYMAVPWQADFYKCAEHWWPAQRPDDVVPQEVFEAANSAWTTGDAEVSEGLEDRKRWDRGLRVTNIYRRPWQNPPTYDPQSRVWAGHEDMVRYWGELGVVVPRVAVTEETVQVESERTPYAGMDIRQLFHALLNLEGHRDCLPKTKEYVEHVLAAARELQKAPRTLAWLDHIKPFRYSEEAFTARMNDIYDDTVDHARKVPLPGVQWAHYKSREDVVERIRQLTPFNLLDGAWLRNINRMGPTDEVRGLLFGILVDELGNGEPEKNHANIYETLCHSVGYYPPPVSSKAFASDPSLLDAAFESPVFQLAISEFTDTYYPEIIGMTLFLEWSVLTLYRPAALLEHYGIDFSFYRLHLAIDNAENGHGERIIRAIKVYLDQVRVSGGDEAVQSSWKRIWDGYVAFGYTLAIILEEIKHTLKTTTPLKRQMCDLVRRKQAYGQYNHGMKKLGKRRINDWFNHPAGFLDALVERRYIIRGDPDNSPFFRLLEFEGGPMYRVFTGEEIKLWREWTLSLAADTARFEHWASWLSGQEPFAEVEVKHKRRRQVKHKRRRQPLELIDWLRAPALIPDGPAREARDRRVEMWFECAREKTKSKEQMDKDKESVRRQSPINVEKYLIEERLKPWLGSSVVRVVMALAPRLVGSFCLEAEKLTDLESTEARTLAWWFDQVRLGDNPDIAARRLLAALRKSDLIVVGKPEASAFVTDVIDRDQAFSSVVSGNDDCSARQTIVEWIKNGCPLSEVAEGSMKKPLRLEATIDEEERHPTGVILGMGCMH